MIGDHVLFPHLLRVYNYVKKNPIDGTIRSQRFSIKSDPPLARIPIDKKLGIEKLVDLNSKSKFLQSRMDPKQN